MKGDGRQKTKLKNEKEQEESPGATEENTEHKKSDQSHDEEKQKDGSSASKETKDNPENTKGTKCSKKFLVPWPLNQTEKWCLDISCLTRSRSRFHYSINFPHLSLWL